jgi:hypothetical protein
MPQRNHEQLFEVTKRMPTDFQPYGQRSRISNGPTQPDCSGNCRFFKRLADGAGFDWGACVNPQGPRVGLLTYEHFGCPLFEQQNPDEDDVPDNERPLDCADAR